MSNRRSQLLRAAQEATAAYAYCHDNADDARRALSLGMGNIADVTTKTYLEAEARSRWLRASDAFVNS